MSKLILLIISIHIITSLDKNDLLKLSQLSKPIPSNMLGMKVCIFENTGTFHSFTSSIANFQDEIMNYNLPTQAIDKINGIVYSNSVVYNSFSVYIGSPVRDQVEIIEGDLNEIIGIVQKNNDIVEIVFSKITVKAYLFKRLDSKLYGAFNARPQIFIPWVNGGFIDTYLGECRIRGSRNTGYPAINLYPIIECSSNQIYFCITRFTPWEEFRSISSAEINVVVEYLSYYGYDKLRSIL